MCLWFLMCISFRRFPYDGLYFINLDWEWKISRASIRAVLLAWCFVHPASHRPFSTSFIKWDGKQEQSLIYIPTRCENYGCYYVFIFFVNYTPKNSFKRHKETKPKLHSNAQMFGLYVFGAFDSAILILMLSLGMC